MKPLAPLDLDELVRFWGSVDKLSGSDCWLWVGYINNRLTNPRPMFCYQSDKYYAARVAYFIEYKVDPGELEVCHECDRPLCVNPDHLWLGTQKDNMVDCFSKGRGQLGNHTKLKPGQREQICELYATGSYTYREIAEAFGISWHHVRGIVKGRQ